MSSLAAFSDRTIDWRARLALIVETMREMSRQTDPQAMVRAYGQRVAQLLPVDRRISLSRRGLTAPRFRITRSSTWNEDINPWKEKDRLPLLEGGLLAKLIYADEPWITDTLEYDPDDPAAEYLAGQGSLMAIPMYDQGVALNMVVLMRREAAGFTHDQLPEWVWMSNLFGRAAQNLVLSEELKTAYEAVDRELKMVADIQRSLLPAELPHIPTMDLAAYYHTSARAGGDYYDFFPLPDEKWGILLADVSGHGTPAAVLMAITHSIAHTYPAPPIPPALLLNHVNHHLTTRYTAQSDTFVTAFYGIYDSKRRELNYACAGHNPPRLKPCRGTTVVSLDEVSGLPLGISAEENYGESVLKLNPGDQIVFYTDGITDANNPAGQMFGLDRLDQVLGGCRNSASNVLGLVLAAVDQFAEGRPADDDRTLIIGTIS
jgi:phosphoserine phosphatase RsbU/P